MSGMMAQWVTPCHSLASGKAVCGLQFADHPGGLPCGGLRRFALGRNVEALNVKTCRRGNHARVPHLALIMILKPEEERLST